MIKPRLLAAFAAMFLSGCVGIHEPDIVRGPDYQPVNVFVAELPADLQRVAAMPLTAARNDRNHLNGVTTLGPLLQRGLAARQAFETLPVSTKWLRQETDRESWRVNESLPPELLFQVTQAHACDAVLFAHLTEYHPYPPLRIGWQLKLVTEDGHVLWSVDEHFDASNPQIVSSARRFYQSHQWGIQANGHSRAILDSPRRFGAYSISASLQTLGGNLKNIAKVQSPTADN